MQELQDRIIEEILHIKDVNVLGRILEMIEREEQTPPHKLSEGQKESIRISRKQIKQGQFVTHDQLMHEMETWLSTR